jgi:hypothetical protein
MRVGAGANLRICPAPRREGRWPATVSIDVRFVAGREGRCVQAAVRCAILSLSP